MADISSLCIIIAILSVEGLRIFVLDISNAFHNTILINPVKRVYLSLPHIYLEWFKIKCPNHLLASINQKDLYIQAIKLTQGKNLLENSGMN